VKLQGCPKQLPQQLAGAGAKGASFLLMLSLQGLAHPQHAKHFESEGLQCHHSASCTRQHMHCRCRRCHCFSGDVVDHCCHGKQMEGPPTWQRKLQPLLEPRQSLVDAPATSSTAQSHKRWSQVWALQPLATRDQSP